MAGDKRKHTQGPFEVSERFMTNEGQRAIMAPDAELGRKRVALIDAQKKFKRGEGWKLEDDSERDANAKLFSAADEMAKALEAITEALAKHGGGKEREAEIQAAWEQGISALKLAGRKP